MASKSFVFRCPICKVDTEYFIEPSEVPWCQGPDGTHLKKMDFVPEKSSYEPDYNRHKRARSKK